jgi:hypothetical protein
LWNNRKPPLSLGEAFDALNQSSYALIAFILGVTFCNRCRWSIRDWAALFFQLGWRIIKACFAYYLNA